MAKLFLLLVTLSIFSYVSANFSSSLNVETSDGTQPIATTLSQWLVDTVSQKIVALARFFNLKFRVVRFLVSLYTTENLLLLRNLLEEGTRFGNFIVSFLPQSQEDPLYWWVPALSQFINISVGDSGLFGAFLGSVASDNVTEEASEVSEITTNPPIFFSAPLSSSTETSTADNNEVFDVRSRRSMEEKSAEQENEESNVMRVTREDLLKKYEENVISLDKLINGGARDTN